MFRSKSRSTSCSVESDTVPDLTRHLNISYYFLRRKMDILILQLKSTLKHVLVCCPGQTHWEWLVNYKVARYLKDALLCCLFYFKRGHTLSNEHQSRVTLLDLIAAASGPGLCWPLEIMHFFPLLDRDSKQTDRTWAEDGRRMALYTVTVWLPSHSQSMITLQFDQ